MDPLIMNIVFFIVCAVGAVFLIASICCFIRHCDFLSEDEEERNNAERYRPIRRKVLNKITSSLRRMTSRRSRALLHSMKTEKDPKCAICLDNLLSDVTEEKRKVIGLLNKCDHLFHFDCIWKWIENNSSCPICRTAMTVSTKNIEAISGSAFLKLLQEAGFDKKDPEKGSLPQTPNLDSKPSTSHARDKSVQTPEVSIDSLTRDSDVTSPSANELEAEVTTHVVQRPFSAPCDNIPRVHAVSPRRGYSSRPNQRLSEVNFAHPGTRPYVINVPSARAPVRTESGPAFVLPVSVNPSEYEWERVDLPSP